MKTCLVIVLGFFPSSLIIAQECVVEKESLKGHYAGECKKGKAHGKGKATGIDIYEGDFKSGVPDGQGTYTWSNGNVFTGKYSRGLREGKGIMKIKMPGRADSVVEGFWKKDAYVGKYEKPWEVHGKTGSIRDVDVEFTADELYRVKIIITNTTGGSTSIGYTMPKYKVDNIQLLAGSYGRLTSLESHLKSTESTLLDVQYPLRMKLNIAREELEIELYANGSYVINIAINE